MGTNGAKVSKTLLDGHNSLLVKVDVVLHLTVEHVGCGTLHSIVELVFPQTLGCLSHPVVGPSCVLLTMKVLVVFNVCQALLEDVGVEQWVERVTRHRECVDLARHNTGVLLTCQVL